MNRTRGELRHDVLPTYSIEFKWELIMHRIAISITASQSNHCFYIHSRLVMVKWRNRWKGAGLSYHLRALFSQYIQRSQVKLSGHKRQFSQRKVKPWSNFTRVENIKWLFTNKSRSRPTRIRSNMMDFYPNWSLGVVQWMMRFRHKWLNQVEGHSCWHLSSENVG